MAEKHTDSSWVSFGGSCRLTEKDMFEPVREHLAILRCPISKQRLRALEFPEIEQLNRLIAKGTCRFLDGTPVLESLEAGLISADGRFIYRVQHRILCMLPDQAILASGDSLTQHDKAIPTRPKEEVQEFYDRIGWKKIDENTYSDASRFEDLRSVSHGYISNCHLRVARNIRKNGKYILDAASGPIQYEEYLAYSDDYDFRICIDISLLALREASRKIGDKGIFVQANITNLPLADNCVDAVVSLHTIYHVPAQEQFGAFRELYRVLKPGATAAIVYSWGSYSPLMTVTMLPLAILRWPLRLIRQLRKRLKRPVSAKNEPTLYFFHHPRRKIQEELGKFCDFDIVVWRSVSVLFLRVYSSSPAIRRPATKFYFLPGREIPALFRKSRSLSADCHAQAVKVPKPVSAAGTTRDPLVPKSAGDRYRSLSSSMRIARAGEPSRPTNFKGRQARVYKPARTPLRFNPSTMMIPAFSKARCVGPDWPNGATER